MANYILIIMGYQIMLDEDCTNEKAIIQIGQYLNEVTHENEQLKKQLNELNKYCTACDDTLTTIQELTYKLLIVDFKDTETKADYCHLLNELDNKDLSFIHDCIKAINKCDLMGMTQLIREW